MQEILTPDYLNGTHVPKDLEWEFFIQTINKFEPYCEIKEEGLYIDTDVEVPITILGKSMDMSPYEVLEGDDTLKMFYCGYWRYKQLKGKNYVIGKDLTKALRSTLRDVSVKHFPENFCAFISLPDVFPMRYYGAFVRTYVSIKGPAFHIGWLCKTYLPEHDKTVLTPGHFYAYFNETDTLDSIVKSTATANGSMVYETDETDMQFMRTVVQAMMYIKHTDDELVEEINSFAKKRSKYESQKKVYTSLPYIRVGFNFQLPRTFSVDSTLVSGFWRWQHYGSNNSLLKYIYIDPHQRRYNDSGKASKEQEVASNN